MRRLAATLLLLFPLLAGAQPPKPEAPLGAAERAQVIDAAIEALRAAYVFPEVAARMAESLRARQRAGEYDRLPTAESFADALTGHLQSVSRDRHLHVIAGGVPGAPGDELAVPANQGFEKVEVLPGNIGYVELRSFQGEGPASIDAAANAMTAVAGTTALIVDLRRNGGGNPEMVALVSSYLFDQPTHLNDLHWREGDRTVEFWTTRSVRGKRFGQAKPVYVLTSSYTFSGGEEFAYNLKSLKRAKIVGETTGGGANPGALRALNERFSMFLPTGRAINPITRTNWEGTGVTPDVAVPADKALESALQLIRAS